VHRFEDHTAEVKLVVEAETLAALFEETALALAELMSTAILPATSTIHVTVESSDRDALLVDWIDELVYRSEIDKRIYAHAKIRRVTDRAIEAEIGGFEPPAIRTAVKAATMHDLSVTDTREGVSARVVLDV
jgi:SHS2 domain-containing protein